MKKVLVKTVVHMGKIIEVKVVPNSKVNEVVEGVPLLVRVKEPPERGRANAAVLKLLSKHFGCEVRIVGGFKKKRKIVELKQ